jgi:nitroreductase
VLKKLKNLAKDLLANPSIRSAYNNSNRVILSIFSSSRLLATLYGLVGFFTFNREQYAVVRGRRNYYRNLNRSRKTHIELRRNIHRIEKGITMQPRRPVFARDYIDETIDFYEEAIAQYHRNEDSLDRFEIEWAHDVLRQYFSLAAADDRIVAQARTRYEDTLKVFTVDNTPRDTEKAPFLRKDGVKANVAYEDLLSLSMQRRSVRWFQQKEVPRELIDKALMVGRQAPTACNRMPYEFRIFDDPEMVKKVAGIPFGAAGYAHQIPAIIVLVGKLDSYFSPRDRHAIYVDSSLAAMSFMFALETLGLSSSVINWPDFEPLEAKMQKTLHLDASERVICLIAVGYADPKGGIPFSQKKSLEVFRSYNVLKSE